MKVLAIVCIIVISTALVAVTAQDAPAETAAVSPPVNATADPQPVGDGTVVGTAAAAEPAPTNSAPATETGAAPENTDGTKTEAKTETKEETEPKKTIIDKEVLGLHVVVEKTPVVLPAQNVLTDMFPKLEAPRVPETLTDEMKKQIGRIPILPIFHIPGNRK